MNNYLEYYVIGAVVSGYLLKKFISWLRKPREMKFQNDEQKALYENLMFFTSNYKLNWILNCYASGEVILTFPEVNETISSKITFYFLYKTIYSSEVNKTNSMFLHNLLTFEQRKKIFDNIKLILDKLRNGIHSDLVTYLSKQKEKLS